MNIKKMTHLNFSAIGNGLSLKLKIFKQKLLILKINGNHRMFENSEKAANKIHQGYLGIFNRHTLNPETQRATLIQ
jgi:hypothetical protein